MNRNQVQDMSSDLRAQDDQLRQFDMEFENVREAEDNDFDTAKDANEELPDLQNNDDMLNAVEVDDNLLLDDINEADFNTNISKKQQFSQSHVLAAGVGSGLMAQNQDQMVDQQQAQHNQMMSDRQQYMGIEQQQVDMSANREHRETFADIDGFNMEALNMQHRPTAQFGGSAVQQEFNQPQLGKNFSAMPR